jgi:hypothetical protein
MQPQRLRQPRSLRATVEYLRVRLRYDFLHRPDLLRRYLNGMFKFGPYLDCSSFRIGGVRVRSEQRDGPIYLAELTQRRYGARFRRARIHNVSVRRRTFESRIGDHSRLYGNGNCRGERVHGL